MANYVYIATSLDGYIAAPDGNLDWLETVPAPPGDDLGYSEFINRVQAVVMGRLTFETVVGFNIGWPYPVPGLVLSTTLKTLPEGFAEHVHLTGGEPHAIVAQASALGYENLYIDGGNTIQRFLQAELIDELIVTDIPILLGGGDPLFGRLQLPQVFELVATDVLADHLVKRRYQRKR